MSARPADEVPAGRRAPCAGRAGFTLIELMMVLGLLAIIVGVALPVMVGTVRKAPMRQALSDLQEGVLKARMLAILTGQPAELVLHAADGRLWVRSAAGATPADGEAPPEETPETGTTAEPAPAEAPPAREALPRFSARLHESLAFRQLTVNLQDLMDEPEAVIRFQPNGTCDALTAVLVSEAGEERLLQLEITTGRLRVEEIR